MTTPRLSLVTALLLSASGCNLAPPPAHEQAKASPVSVPAPAPALAPLDDEPTTPSHEPSPIVPGELAESSDHFPAPARLVAIGDVHGDLQATRRALQLAGATDDQDHWIGGQLVLVQTGDQLDRGDDEQAILELFARLQHEAAKAGGAVHVLNGNHEFMNALGDLRYVTPGGMADFEDAPGVDPSAPELAMVLREAPERAKARVAAFWPGQPWARELAKRNVIVMVGDSVFVHGGILPEWAGQMSTINEQARAFLAGDRPQPPHAVIDPNGPVWSRHYSDEPDASDCALLDEALAKLGAKRMVVGHTVHTEGIRSACGDKVWMIDVGLAAHYGGPMQVLQIADGQVSVIAG